MRLSDAGGRRGWSKRRRQFRAALGAEAIAVTDIPAIRTDHSCPLLWKIGRYKKIKLKSEARASPFDEGMVVKKIWRASPDNPAGTPYFLLVTIDIADGATSHDGAAIPSPNPGHNRDCNVHRSGARSVDGAPIRSAPSVDVHVTRGCFRSSNAPIADVPSGHVVRAVDGGPARKPFRFRRAGSPLRLRARPGRFSVNNF